MEPEFQQWQPEHQHQPPILSIPDVDFMLKNFTFEALNCTYELNLRKIIATNTIYIFMLLEN